MRADQIALQLYTVRDRTATDFLGTLRALAATGYTAVEFAGYGDVPVAEMRSTLDELGMRAISAHVPYDRFDSEIDAVIEELQTLGCSYAIVPYIGDEMRGDAAIVRRMAENFNAWGERCRAAGLTFGYHNHDFEFRPIEGEPAGTTMYDILLAETDPASVTMELDIYWVLRGGHDALALLRREVNRIPIIHMKDLGPAPDHADLPVGAGTIDWPAIFAAGEGKVEWFIVEQDHPANAMADVATSLRAMESMAS